MDMVVYHANCNDGFCCAWLAHWAFPDAEFVPAQYGQAPPDVAGKRVLIADFSYKRTTMEDIIAAAHSVTVLDHHRTAAAELDGLDKDWQVSVTFDMDKSGGRLTWEWLTRNGHGVADPDNPPWIVDYSEDRDLWRWALPDSREINAALSSYPLDFDAWDRLAELGHESLIPEGRAILRYQSKVVEQHIAHARLAKVGGHEVFTVNATCLFSEIAGELARGRPFGVAYFDRADGKRQFSLRSREDGIDVSEVAKRFGGGGHAAAAGFELPIGVDPH
jgi:oligoribonuclease NrnB/cAMP/cGMP phosphodiesterase (DHH superfamily)